MSDEPKKQDREEEQPIARAWFTVDEINAWAAKYLIKTWQQRCEEHPDHNGIVSNRMIQARMQEEIDELREANEAFAKRQEWWNDRMFEMEAELQRYQKIAAMRRNKAYEASGHPLPWKPDELWQGLTDDELDAMRQDPELNFMTRREFHEVVRAVEAKLKEKNT